MAVRLINRHRHQLRIDLRGGEVLLLAPGARSAVLREELLYDNFNLPAWERAGWVARVRVPLHEAPPAAPAAAPPDAGGGPVESDAAPPTDALPGGDGAPGEPQAAPSVDALPGADGGPGEPQAVSAADAPPGSGPP